MADFFKLAAHRERCQGITRSGRRCRKYTQPGSDFCWHHQPVPSLAGGGEDYPEGLLQILLPMMVRTGLITLKQLALFRLAVLSALSLGTWLFYQLFKWAGTAWLKFDPALWYTAGLAFLATCWILGNLVKVGFFLALFISWDVFKATVFSFFDKEGLVLNICFLLLPLLAPVWVLYHYELSAWWGLLLFPLGLGCGLLFYGRLERGSGPF
jgi:hypothetical protein